jgi:antitoxin (DNA-binding transcriptional repressor) of toxin-antitoxin stability system
MKEVTQQELERDLTRWLNLAAEEDVVVTRDGQTAVLLSALDEDDLFDWRLVQDPRFQAIMAARREEYVREGGQTLEEVMAELGITEEDLATEEARRMAAGSDED